MRKSALTFKTLTEALQFEVEDARRQQREKKREAAHWRKVASDYQAQIDGLEAKLQRKAGIIDNEEG